MATGSVPAGIFQVIWATFDFPETAGKMASLAVESLGYFSLECKYDSESQDFGTLKDYELLSPWPELSLSEVLNGIQMITSLDCLFHDLNILFRLLLLLN